MADHAPPRPHDILVVDDTPANLRVLEAVLAPAGYAVRFAEGGAEALAQIARSAPDLVLLDVVMPDIDGHEVTRRLRADPATRALPIILITASEDQQKLAALEAGADDFVLKPFDRAELLARVRSLVRIKDAHDTIHRQAAELSELNRTLEERVSEQVEEIASLTRLRRFFSPQLADAIVASGEGDLLESHRAEIAVVFCQLIGFAGFAEGSEPEEVTEVLGAFRTAAGGEVLRAQATLGAFTSEGLMAFLNDPIPCSNPPRKGVDLAMAMREAVGELGVEWRRLGYDLGCGIGVSWGYATLGRSGPPERWDYGPSGSIVTLAGRLAEHAADRQILLSQRAQAALAGEVDGELTPELPLRGFRGPVRAFSLAGMVGAASREGLTARELEVLRLVTEGVSNRVIGERLYITEATVARHVANIFGKLGAHTRAEATAIALRRGLLEPSGGLSARAGDGSRARTILFTDLEGSTALAQSLGDDGAVRLLRIHDGIVREALARHDGREVKHTGDGIMASLGSVQAALQSAVDIQRGFADYNASHEPALKVRIGISAGEPVAEGDDLFGATVQLAARLCDHADPGMIVVSGVVRDLAIGKGFAFGPGQEASLKGFPQPVTLCEVTWSTAT